MTTPDAGPAVSVRAVRSPCLVHGKMLSRLEVISAVSLSHIARLLCYETRVQSSKLRTCHSSLRETLTSLIYYTLQTFYELKPAQSDDSFSVTGLPVT